MSGISQGSGAFAARIALDAAIRAALTGDGDVDIRFGFQWPITKTAWVSLTGTSADTDPATIGPRRSQDETITLHASIGAWVAGRDDDTARAAFERAFGVLDTIQTHIRQNDITLSGTVLWCVPGAFDSDGITDEDGSGYVAEIDATFVCMHRMRLT